MSNKPTRYQRKRSKGWKKPPGAVLVTRPSKYGNPYRITKLEDGYHIVVQMRKPVTLSIAFPDKRQAAEFAVKSFRSLAQVSREWKQYIEELRGKDLVCWCKPGEPCHADVLLELANT
jgi:hypothetical protein